MVGLQTSDGLYGLVDPDEKQYPLIRQAPAWNSKRFLKSMLEVISLEYIVLYNCTVVYITLRIQCC